MGKEKISILYGLDGRYLSSLEKKFLTKIKNWRNAQMEILRQSKPLTDYDQEKWFQQIREDKNQSLFSIIAKNEKNKKMKFIGYCGITYIDYKNRRGALSFIVDTKRALNKEIYKRDFMAVLNMICHYGFEELNLNKIFTETFSFRKNHISILEEFGFHFDGILREHHFAHGRYYDSIIHSLLANEWRTKQKKSKNDMEK